MARKSRKETVTAQASSDVRSYKTAIYVRLSREDERKIQSESVESQIAFLKDFVEKDASMTLVDEYVDRHVTGTKFDRPEFNRMIADIRSGKINCVAVRDLSRLGRNYLEAGDYIEKIFPFFGVRFIAVTDHYDSLTAEPAEEGLVVPLKNLINEAYAKDISKKICSSFENQFKQGVYLATRAAYGYKKDPNDTHMLLVDEEVRDVVVRIFRDFVAGKNKTQIARELNAEGVPSPRAYWKSKGLLPNTTVTNLWEGSVIGKMMQNPVYTGDVQIGKTQKCYYKGIIQPVKRDGYYVEDHHEAIIDRGTFVRVQDIIKKQRQAYLSSLGKYGEEKNSRTNLFKGLLYCGNCGNRMTIHRVTRRHADGSVGHYSNYVCNRSAQYGEADPRKSVKVEALEELIMRLIRAHIAVYVDARDKLKILNRKPAAKGKKAALEKRLAELSAKRDRVGSFMRNLYEDFTEEVLTEGEYLDMKVSYVSELDSLEAEISELKALLETYSSSYAGDSEMAEAFGKYTGAEELSREMVETFITKITCYDKDTFEVDYRFADALQRLADLAEKRREEA